MDIECLMALRLSGLRYAVDVEQRACRAGPEGVSRVAANNRTQFDEESGRRKAKTRLLGGFFK
ncbi:hypothetical protein EGH57_12760 [Klebsiella aerogenes]|jgi:hypothetical protein|uniref:Uncharacterized protein n=1 Tax=Klebsiella aerogenes (strain ATCC 13048 / DSM 30053 / CCUG 1429 / JCM 1235 / KCTC 2190 / NBRC 13534 / NCIMB 10102 / NCTC 10006 / CDC 819-56) TaxID=1028307 RepID=A0A0H3FMN2_KLEAK|nr:hypothetical protein EAE_08840 [Klebsiella aerogenes KCTC 2190]QEU20416.1 hypothetical protein FOB49_18080 [Klebsiella aerogenes]QHJ53880.1 hypothetical protein GUU79_23045 [Klebsiella aerogenes]RSV87569.1 hypothetical protein EGH57_12760 [Klebsiella aerogenes]RSW44941.1 hypothetical protein EGH44_18790 [Klebsiella aerogenes]